MALCRKRPLLLLAALCVPAFAFAAPDAQVSSPDGSIQFKVSFKDGLFYSVDFKNKPVIESSPLSFTLDGVEIAGAARPGDVFETKTYQRTETFPWRGVHSVASNHCQGSVMTFKHGDVTCSL